MPRKNNKVTLKQRLKCKKLARAKYITKSIRPDLIDFYIKTYEKMKDMNYFKDPYKICAGAFNPDLSNRTINNKTGLPLITMQDYTDYLSQFVITPYNILTITQLMICVLMYFHIDEMGAAMEAAILEFIEANKEKDERVKEIAEKYEEFDVKGQIKDQSVNFEAENAFLTYLCTTYHMKNVMFDIITDTHRLITDKKDEVPVTTKIDPLFELIDKEYFKNWVDNKEPFTKMYNYVQKIFKSNDKLNHLHAKIRLRYFTILGEITNFFNWLFGKKEINYFDYYKERMFNNYNLSNMKYYRNMFSETASNLNRAAGVLENLEEMADVFYMYVKEEEIPQELIDKYLGDNYNKTLTSLITLYENCGELFGLAYDTTIELCLEYKIRSKLIN